MEYSFASPVFILHYPGKDIQKTGYTPHTTVMSASAHVTLCGRNAFS